LPEDTMICENEAPITIQPDQIFSGLIYSWSNGDTATSINVDTTGEYEVMVYDATTQCEARDQIMVTVNDIPEITMHGDTVCDGQYGQLGFSTTCGGCQVIWNDTFQGIFFSPNEQGWQVVEITNLTTGCSATDSAWLEVESTESPDILPGYETDICENDTVVISVLNNYTTYSWSNGSTTKSIKVFNSGVFAVTVSTPSGCLAYADSIVVNARPAPDPEITVDITLNWKTRMTGSPGFQSYLWSNGEGDPITIADADGTYYLTVTDEFGCFGVDSVTVDVIPAGVEELEGLKVAVYPNPADLVVNIQWPGDWNEASSIQLIDGMGRLVLREATTSSLQSINVESLPAGIYSLKLITTTDEKTIRIAIE
jgi:hypothetical protein